MNFPKFSFLSFSLLSLAILATPVKAESLSDAVLAALETHPSVESATASLAAAAQSRTEEFSGYFPALSVVGSGGRIFGDNSTTRGFNTTRGTGYSYLWEGSFTARQTLFDGFETQSRVGAARARLNAADLGLTDIRETLAFRTVQAYIEAMQAYEALGMFKAHEAKVLDYVDRIKLSVDEGVADDTQYQQAQDIKVILDGFIADYGARVDNAQAQYLALTGHLPEGDMAVPAPGADFVPEKVEAALQYAALYHPGLQAATYTAQSTRYDISSEQAQLYPAFNGELSYLKSDKDDVLGGEARDARAMVRMNWNFEIGGAQFARIQRKKKEHEVSKSRAEELKQQITTAVQLAFTELDTAMAQLENKKKRQDLNAKLFETYEIQFEGARINLVQLMQADNQLFNTGLEKMLGEYRVLNAQYALLASIGRLREALSLQEGGAQEDE